MIIRPSNWNDIKEPTERRTLSVTAAVAGIKKAVVQEDDYGAKLCILFDIIEGDFKQWKEAIIPIIGRRL